MQIKDLIPVYKELTELYQSEDFKPLGQFLSESKKELEQELFQISEVDSKISVHRLVAQINLLGTILELPKMVRMIRDQFEANELRIQKARATQVDPIYKGDS